MKLYLAAPWARREEAQRMSKVLEAAGHTITWKWWEHETSDHDVAQMEKDAIHDYRGVCNADVVVLLNLMTSEGKAVEQGIAIARGIPIVAMGNHPSNIFQNLKDCYTWVSSEADLLSALAE